MPTIIILSWLAMAAFTFWVKAQRVPKEDEQFIVYRIPTKSEEK